MKKDIKNPSKRTERWTYGEFVEFITKRVVEKNPQFEGLLDYAQADFCMRDVASPSATVRISTRTDWGGSEGVYTDFNIALVNGGSGPGPLGCAKTLEESTEAFRKMSAFGCEFKLEFEGYIAQNSDEFYYTGYQVGESLPDGTIKWLAQFNKLEHAVGMAERRKEQRGGSYIVRDNATRKTLQEITDKAAEEVAS